MENIEKKTIGELIDELCTTNNKIFWALERANKARKKRKRKKVGRYYGMAQGLNSKRSKLIQAVNNRLGEGNNNTSEKTF